jgi:membrane associated rhomboid family serine protease
MIPLKSEEPRRSLPIVTIILIVANLVIFFYQLSLPPRAANALVSSLGIVPVRAERMLVHPMGRIGPALVPLVTSMFLHGGWLHVLGNMLFLWVFGGNVEDRLGHLRYLGFYLICGIGSGLVHILANWGSALPTIGASGAISGVMGAYIVMFPRSRVLTLVPLIIFFFTFRLPAVLILGYWFVIQFLSGISSLGDIDQGGVAWWAHVGGFLLGAFLVWGVRQSRSRPSYYSY